MPSVTLSWDDPEDAAEFLALRRDLRRQGWLSDSAGHALRELVEKSEVTGSSEEGDGDGE